MIRRSRVDSTYAVAVDAATSAIGRALHDSSVNDFTGALALSGPMGAVRIYCFEGGAYAAEVGGFAPDVEGRLRAAGRLGEDDDVRAALAAQRLQPEDLAMVHQEFLLAVIGRLAELPAVEVERLPRITTAAWCTLPIPWESLVEILRVRQARLVEDLSHVGGTASAEVVLAARGASPQGLAELAALWTALGSGTELDDAARACGFTRAEALHLAARLLADGGATVVATKPRRSGAPQVPEAIGAQPRR